MGRKVKGMTRHKMMVANRQKILLEEIIMQDPKRKWTSRTLAAEALEHPWFQEFMPSYSKSTAYNDLVQIQDNILETREELAEEYIKIQLDISHEEQESILSTWRELDEVPLPVDPEERLAWLGRIANSKNKLAAAIDRPMKRQAALLPIDVPKKLQVDQRTLNVQGTIDKLLEVQDRLRLEAAEIIDGEVINEEEME